MIEQILQSYQHLMIVATLVVGLYILMAYDNLIKKLIGLGLMQSAVFVFFILGAQLQGGAAPILPGAAFAVGTYVNPLPHVLILTAIVVGIAATAMGLALATAISRCYDSIDEAEIQAQVVQRRQDRQDARNAQDTPDTPNTADTSGSQDTQDTQNRDSSQC